MRKWLIAIAIVTMIIGCQSNSDNHKEKQLQASPSKLEKLPKMGKNLGQNKNFKGDARMQKAYRVAAKLNMIQIAKEDQRALQYLKNLQESDVVVVTGSYDHGEAIFEMCSIPYSLISVDQLASLDLRNDQVLFINCPGNIDAGAIERVRSFVEGGGMLVTTDWALKNVLEKAFPGRVAYNGKPTQDDVVRIVFEPVEDTFVKGLYGNNEEPLWWLEGASYPIKILSSSVTVLASSKEMKEKYGESPIVVSFEYGQGKVYHMTSHYYLQRTETRSARQKKTAGSYLEEKGISKNEYSEEELEDVQAGEVESAYSSVRSALNIIVEQQERVSNRKK